MILFFEFKFITCVNSAEAGSLEPLQDLKIWLIKPTKANSSPLRFNFKK